MFDELMECKAATSFFWHANFALIRLVGSSKYIKRQVKTSVNWLFCMC